MRAELLVGQLGGGAEGAFDASGTHGVDHVVGQAEGDKFGFLERQAFVEEAVEVNVEDAAAAFF